MNKLYQTTPCAFNILTGGEAKMGQIKLLLGGIAVEIAVIIFLLVQANKDPDADHKHYEKYSNNFVEWNN